MPAKCEQAINESLFTQMFAPERTQTSMMADEKSPARNSHRHFATKQLISLEMEKNMEKHITAPLKESDIKDLKAGDYVYITGTIYTARDAAHKRMYETIGEHKELPIKMQDTVIYYMGPSPARQGRPIGSAGPTTASRMDK